MAIDSDSEYSDIDEREAAEYDSDRELQAAFERGDLKPGLNVVREKFVKEYKNDVTGLKHILTRFTLNLPWIEKLDLCNEPAPLAPEMAVEMEEHRQTKAKKTQLNIRAPPGAVAEDVMHDDFQREMIFYRQAQAAVLEAIPRLRKLGVPTKRPNDYFAQMAKSDDHMQKVRKRLMSRQVGQQLSERAKKLRELRRYGKKVQVEVQQEKQKEKRTMLDKITKFRKGQADSIDFLEDGPQRIGKEGGAKGYSRKEMNKSKVHRQMKDKKYGYGGQKREGKRNDAASSAYNVPKSVGGGKNKFAGMKGKGGARGGKGGKSTIHSSGRRAQRPGKARRQQGRKK